MDERPLPMHLLPIPRYDNDRHPACAEDKYEQRRDELWWSEAKSTEEIANAKEAARICVEECPVLADCRTYAEAYRPRGGVWGGVLWVQSRGNGSDNVSGMPSRRDLLG
jgi:hypothetical protein